MKVKLYSLKIEMSGETPPTSDCLRGYINRAGDAGQLTVINCRRRRRCSNGKTNGRVKGSREEIDLMHFGEAFDLEKKEISIMTRQGIKTRDSVGDDPNVI